LSQASIVVSNLNSAALRFVMAHTSASSTIPTTSSIDHSRSAMRACIAGVTFKDAQGVRGSDLLKSSRLVNEGVGASGP
jgi:hypothetical protein